MSQPGEKGLRIYGQRLHRRTSQWIPWLLHLTSHDLRRPLPSLSANNAPTSSHRDTWMLTAGILLLYVSVSIRKTKQGFASYSLFRISIISSVQSQCLLPLCSQHGWRWRILSSFSYITNHKAALPHSLIASVSRLIVSNYPRHIRISSLCIHSSIPGKHLAVYSFLSTQTSVTLWNNQFHYNSSFIIHCNNLQLTPHWQSQERSGSDPHSRTRCSCPERPWEVLCTEDRQDG